MELEGTSELHDGVDIEEDVMDADKGEGLPREDKCLTNSGMASLGRSNETLLWRTCQRQVAPN